MDRAKVVLTSTAPGRLVERDPHPVPVGGDFCGGDPILGGRLLARRVEGLDLYLPQQEVEEFFAGPRGA